jgi:NodT family efflux transporter outer membrane factor (OMF) lipoprotein
MVRTRGLVVLALLTLAGCATGPAYVRPDVAVPMSYKEAESSDTTPGVRWSPASPRDLEERGDWWSIFGDPQLQQLESQATAANQSIDAALARLLEARAQVRVARSGYSPTVTAGPTVQSQHLSRNVVGHGLAGQTVEDYAAGVNVAWEPDLFGKVKHQVESARAQEQATAADLAAIRLSIQAQVATDYFDLVDAHAQWMLLQKTVGYYEQALTLVKQRFEVGVASDLEVAQAQTQLESTQAQLNDLNIRQAQLEHAIATLVGQPASSFSLQTRGNELAPPAIPSGVPSQLLERRPDIAAAERRVAASHADVNEARSAFFPDLILAATGGLESSNPGSWFALPSRFWAIGPALVGTLADGGRRKGQLEANKALYRESVANYRQTVLTAFQEVEDWLAAGQQLSDEATVQEAAVQSSERALRIAMDRYKGGAVSYLEVVTAQNTALANERIAADIARRQIDTSVALIKALGGVWGNEPANPAG